jgi:hypothetical protein
VGTPGQVVLSGSLTATSGDRSAAATLDGLLYVTGDCYPSGGTASLASERFTGTITFLPTTPQDGLVEVGRGRLKTSAPLPAYGGCPPG